MLGAADFSYLGSYAVDNLDGLTFGSGLTLRYVEGQLRFLTFSYRTGEAAALREFALPDGSNGRGTQGNANAAITRTTASWPDIWSPFTGPSAGGGDHFGLWWEARASSEGGGRLWTTRAVDYPNDVQLSHSQAISVRELRADGTVTNRFGEYGFEAIGQRAIYGGVQPIPAWFAEQHRLKQRYVAGWGGYSSRLAQGLVPSLGLMMLAIPDVTGYPVNPAGSLIPATDLRILADHRSGSVMATDWYSGAANPPAAAPFDRGARTPNVINYLDGGDNRPNGSTAEPPAGLPLASAQWLSPAPDGRGRMVWNDSFNATGNWVDGDARHGFVVVLTGSAGKAWYCNSQLCDERKQVEIQVFDPQDFSAVLRATKAPWNVQPTTIKPITGDSGLARGGRVAGAAFDVRTRILWLWWPGIDGAYGNRLLAYRVAS